MSHPTPHFGLTISPDKSPAQINSIQTVTVYDQGKTPLVVTMSTAEITRNVKTGKCEVSPHQASWATVTPVHFTLKPGTHRNTTLTIHTAAPGKHDLAAWATTPVGTITEHGAILQTNAALGSQFLVTVPGDVPLTAPAPCVTLASPPTAPSFLTPTTLAAGISGLFILLLLVAIVVRRSYNRRHPA